MDNHFLRMDALAALALLFALTTWCSRISAQTAEEAEAERAAKRSLEQYMELNESRALIDAVRLDAAQQSTKDAEAWYDSLDPERIVEFNIADGSLLDAVRQVSIQGWRGSYYFDEKHGPSREEAAAIQVKGFRGAVTVRQAIDRVLSGTGFVATFYRNTLGIRVYRPQGMSKDGVERPVLISFAGGRLDEEADYLFNRTGTRFPTGQCTQVTTTKPVSGKFTTLEAWIQLLRPICNPARYTLSEFIENNAILWYAALVNLAGRREIDFNIEAKARKDVIRDIARQTGLTIPYLPKTIEEEDQIIGPIRGRMSIHKVLYEVARDTILYPRWIDRTTVAIEPLPFYPEEICEDENLCSLVRTLPETGEIQVTATRLPTPEERASITDRVGDASSIIVDRQRIDELGASSVPEVLQRLSQSAFTESSGYRSNGAQYANGRGIGTAIVLVEGQRTMASAGSLQESALDLNTIPLSAVERIEFIPDGGSIVHGVDAVGGIVNIVLRRPSEGLTTEARYGSAHGGAIERRFTAFARGKTLNRDAVLIADQLEITNLPGATRSRFSNMDYSRYRGGIDRRSLTSAEGNLQLGFDGPIVGLPSADGRESFEARDLLPRPNLTSLLRYQSISPARERASLVAVGNLHFDRIELAANAIYTHQETEYTLPPPSVSGEMVASDHPQNPLNQPLLYYGLLTGLPSQQVQTSSDLFRGAAALATHTLGWTVELSLTYTRERYSSIFANVLDPIAVADSLNGNDAATALHFFARAPGSGREDLLATSLPDKFAANASFVHLLGERNFALLPGGNTRLQIGADWRNEENSSVLVEGVPTRDATGVFVSLGVPVLKALSLSAGARRDHYSDGDSVISRQFGFEWTPADFVKIHGYFGERYRPPSLFELYMIDVPYDIPITDPKTGRTAMATVLASGRRDLRPTSATSATLGLSFTSQKDLEFSIDYWQMRLKDRISALPLIAALRYEDLLPGRVIREPSTIEGVPGQIRTIDIGWQNLGEAQTTGVDFRVRKQWPAWSGHVVPELGVTWISQYKDRNLPAEISPLVDRVGIASQRGTILRHRAVAQLAWESEAWRFAANITEHPSYRDQDALGQGQITVRSETRVDLNVCRRWGETSVSVGAINVFDSEPGFVNASSFAYDPSQGDLRGRFLFGEFRIGF